MKFFFIMVLMIPVFISGQNKRPLTVEDLWNIKRVENYSVSRDGKTIAFVLRSYSMEENKGNADIYLIDVTGNNLRPFKNGPVNETNPRFHPDGSRISFVRDGQVWISNFDGSNEQQLTEIYTKAADHKWANDGKRFLFTSNVYPDCPDSDCAKKKDEEQENSKVKAKIFDALMYRHWDEWRGEKRSHLFMFDMESKTTADLNLNSPFDVPPLALGSDNDFSFSPVGNEVAFTMNQSNFLSVSTNNDIFITDITKLKKR